MKYINKSIKDYLSVDNIVLILFFISIISLPSNLSKTWQPTWSFYQGIFIEQWAPKLYLSQVLLTTTLFIIALNESKKKLFPSTQFLTSSSKPKNSLFFHQKTLTIFILILFLSTRALIHEYPEHFLVWVAQCILGPGVLILLLQKKPILRAFPWAILTSTFIQALYGITQYINQKSIFTYYAFGETQFRNTLNIARSTLRTASIVLPYGTTPHPNILAGWMILGVGALLLLRKYINAYVFYGIGAILVSTILLTESFSALVSIPVILLFFSGKYVFKPLLLTQKAKLVFLSLCIAIFWSFLPLFIYSQQEIPSSLSVTRRAIPLKKVLESPQKLFSLGTGLSHSFPEYNSSQDSQNIWKFPQPLHNSALIIIFELGFCTSFLLFIYLFFELDNYSFYFVIFIMNFPILYLDHYLTTHLMGQYILISFMLFFTHYKDSKTS